MNSKRNHKTAVALAAIVAAFAGTGLCAIESKVVSVTNGTESTDSAYATIYESPKISDSSYKIIVDKTVEGAMELTQAQKLSLVESRLAVLEKNAVNVKTVEEEKKQAEQDELLTLLKSLYEREVETPTGREKWHGKLKNQIVSTNDLVKVSVYADGKEFTDAWKLEKPKDMVAQAARKLTAMTNGIPAKLAAARAKRVAAINKGVEEVSVTVEVGKDKQIPNNGNGNGGE